MPGVGSSESAAKNLGETIARLRTKRKWSRSRLVGKVLRKLKEDDTISIGEEALKDIEDGTRVNTPRRLIDLLMEALEVTPAERLEVLLTAGLNFLDDGTNGSGRQSEFFHSLYTKIYCNPVTYAMLDSLLEDREVENLDIKELLHILNTVVDLSAESSLQLVSSSKGNAAVIKAR